MSTDAGRDTTQSIRAIGQASAEILRVVRSDLDSFALPPCAERLVGKLRRPGVTPPTTADLRAIRFRGAVQWLCEALDNSWGELSPIEPQIIIHAREPCRIGVGVGAVVHPTAHRAVQEFGVALWRSIQWELFEVCDRERGNQVDAPNMTQDRFQFLCAVQAAIEWMDKELEVKKKAEDEKAESVSFRLPFDLVEQTATELIEKLADRSSIGLAEAIAMLPIEAARIANPAPGNVKPDSLDPYRVGDTVVAASAGRGDGKRKRKGPGRPRSGETGGTTKTLCALIDWHGYENGGVSNYNAATNPMLAEKYELANNALTKFLKAKDVSIQKYQAACQSKRIGALLMLWSGELPSRRSELREDDVQEAG